MGAIFIDNVRKNHLLSGYPEEEYAINIPNPCVSGDTVILTNRGYLPIKELVGKEIVVWNGNEWSTVTPKVTGKNQRMKLIKFSNGMELKCTNYHKFVMKDGKLKKAEDLTVGEKLEKWSYPIIGSGNSVLKDAYTHGVYSGDGTKNLNQVCLYGAKKMLLEHLCYESFLHQEYNQGRILVNLKQGNYVKDFVPNETYTIESRLNWLAGLIDTDGCKNDVGGSISVSSIDKEFLTKVQLMISTLGCHSTVGNMHEAGNREMPDGNGGKKEYACSKSYRLVISASSVSELVKLGLSTKRVQLKADPNRNASRFIFITEVSELPVEPLVYCFNEPKNHTGVFNGIMTGQCAEFYGNAWNACNLGSVNLYTLVTKPFTKDADIDWEKLEENVRLGVIALDEILDYGREMQPLEENKKCLDDWRSIGLGVFGLGDALIALGIKYGSGESIELIDKLMSFISRTALETSADLAAEKGTFGKYNWEYIKKSPIIDELKKTDFALYKKIEANGLRNGSLLSIAPNGSIATMCGLSGGVEPLFAISYQRTTHSLSGEKKYFKVFAKSVEDLLKYNFYSQTMTDEEIIERFPFVTISHEIDPHDRIAVQSVMQKYVDNAISSTINLKEEVTVQDVFDIYMDAWESGCKGITIFRNNCLRTAILVTNDSKQLKEDSKQENDKPFEFDSVIPFKAKEVDELDGKRFVKHTACVPSMYINITHKDGNIYEVFTNAGSGCHSNISTITRLASLAFRLGGKVKEVTKEMKANQCPACIVLKQKGDKSISNSCGSAIAEAVEKMYDILQQNPNAVFVPNNTAPTINKSTSTVEYMECPECHEQTLRPEAKCFNCSNCGYSRCE